MVNRKMFAGSVLVFLLRARSKSPFSFMILAPAREFDLGLDSGGVESGGHRRGETGEVPSRSCKLDEGSRVVKLANWPYDRHVRRCPVLIRYVIERQFPSR
ncbi:hypothetical protein WN55_00265 [Dufourea novaeangliae]|uniref:Uncharacterized protein n=1 Tax=Dufourea novaeangliae TaxID=178035 RepID=A0A154PCP4_DUFNO|nr:hypothetical protein WN55_00265 [Dufourea novaeangliae]